MERTVIRASKSLAGYRSENNFIWTK